MDSVYHVRTDVFEGPLELLLQLIEKRKLFINDISLATVTDDYIEQINREGVLMLPHAAQFVYVASTLLLIKSKSLLPTLTLSEEETGDIKNLELRLKLYQRFKELSLSITEIYGKHVMYGRETLPEAVPVFAPGSLTVGALSESISKVLAQLPRPEKLPEAVVATVMSLEEMIDRLSHRITKTLSLSFKEFSGVRSTTEKADRLNVIVSFLALLELVKRGFIGAKQSNHFEDITIESDTIGVPKYN